MVAEELLQREFPFAPGAPDHDPGTESHEKGRQVPAGCGRTEASAYRGPLSYLGSSKHRQRIGKLGSRRGQLGRTLELKDGDKGTKPEFTLTGMDGPELGQVGQGDYMAGCLGPPSKIDEEVCAAGKRDGFGPQLPEKAAGFG